MFLPAVELNALDLLGYGWLSLEDLAGLDMLLLHPSYVLGSLVDTFDVGCVLSDGVFATNDWVESLLMSELVYLILALLSLGALLLPHLLLLPLLLDLLAIFGHSLEQRSLIVLGLQMLLFVGFFLVNPILLGLVGGLGKLVSDWVAWMSMETLHEVVVFGLGAGEDGAETGVAAGSLSMAKLKKGIRLENFRLTVGFELLFGTFQILSTFQRYSEIYRGRSSKIMMIFRRFGVCSFSTAGKSLGPI